MSSRNNIDDFFKKKLGNTGGGEIPEGFLADINSRLNALDKKKKKRGIWWWMAAGMVAGTGLTWGTMTLLSPEQSKVANNYVGDMPADQSHKQQFVRAGWGNTGNEIPITKNQEPGTGKPVTNPTRPVNNSAEVLTTKTTKKPLNNYAVNPHTGVLKNDVKNNVEGGYRYGNDKKIANGRQENGARNNQNISVLVNAGFAGDTAGTHYGNVNDLNRPNGETDFGESINLTINQDSLSQETVQNSNETPPADSLPGNNPISSSPAPNGTKYGTGSKFTLAVAFGVQYVKNTFPGDTMSYYFTKRKSQEKPILGFDASVLVSRKFNNINLTSGLNYSEWGERIGYDAVLHKAEAVVTTIDTATGDTTSTVIDDYISDPSFPAGYKNKYRYVGIPLLIGYKIEISDNFTITPNMGGSVGMLVSNKKGRYVSRYLYGTVYEPANKILFNGIGSVDLLWKRKNFSLMLSPFYRYNLNLLLGRKPNGYSSGGTQTQNRYYSFGLNFGISFDLGH